MSGAPRYREGRHISPRGVRVIREALEDAVRRLDGCEGIVLPDGIASAAVEDGRPYRTFVSHLLALGLETHKKVNP